jgi:PAS domain S-box-containing protein
MKVLLVEDNDGHIDLIKAAFERSSIEYDLKVAKSFKELENLLPRFKFDVSIVDYMLPDSAGKHITILAEKGFPVIVMTAFGGEKEAVESIKSGAVDYIIKSSDMFLHMPQLAQKAISEREISIRKNAAEMALKESENKFKMIADNAPFPIIIISLDSRVLYVNRIAEVIFETTYDNPVNTDGYYFDVSQREAIRVVLEKTDGVKDYEIQLKTHKGRIFWALVSASYVEFGGKKCVLVQLRDISELKKTQDSLRESEELLRSIIDTAKDVIFIKDTSLRYVRVNKAMEKLFGLPPKKILLREAADIFPPDTAREVEEVERKVLKGEVVEEFSERLINGEIHYFHTVKVPLKDVNGLIFGLCGIARDITSRKKMENDLRKSEEMQRLITDNMTDIVSLMDIYRNTLYVSPSIKHELGWNAEEIIGKNAFLLIHPEDVERVVKIARNAINNNLSDFQIEYRFLHKSGKYVWFESVCRILYQNSAYAGLIFGTRNIDQRKNAEESLKRREKILGGIAESSQKLLSGIDFSTVLNETLRILGESSGVDRVSIFKNKKDEKSGRLYICLEYEWTKKKSDSRINLKEMQKIFYDTFLSRWRSFFEEGRTIKGRINDFPSEERSFLSMFGIKCLLAAPIPISGAPWGFITFESFNEDRYWSSGEEAALQTAAGSIAAAIGRKNAEDNLRAGEERFRITLENAPFAIVIFAFDGTIIYVNKHAYNLFNCQSNDVLGKKLAHHFWNDSSEYEKWMSDLKKDEKVKDYEALFTDFDHLRKFSCLTSSIIIDYLDKKVVLAAFHDLSERKKAEEERLNLERHVQQAQRQDSLGVLAGGIAHDFNNLLGVVLGYADLALLKLQGKEPVREDLEEIINAVVRASDLCRQMLTYTGKGRLSVSNFNLLKLINDTTSLLKVMISKKAVLEVNLPESLPLIEADPSQIDQILINLVINASESLENKSGTIRLSLDTQNCKKEYLERLILGKDLPEGEYVCLRVSDTGKGMSSETLERAFEPFFSTKNTGRGLGLSVLMGIVKSHRGALDVRSVPGEGTMFSVYFPTVTKTSKKARKVVKKSKKEWKGSGTIILADDEQTVLDMCKEMLEYLGFEVLIATDGVEAVDLYKKNHDKIRCIILDLTMPNMDGEEALEEIQKLDASAKIIISSGYGEMQILQRFASKKLAAFIQKPYKLDGLKDILSTVLG